MNHIDLLLDLVNTPLAEAVKVETLTPWTLAKLKSTITKLIPDVAEQTTHKLSQPLAFALGVDRGEDKQPLTDDHVDVVNALEPEAARLSFAAGFASTKAEPLKEATNAGGSTEWKGTPSRSGINCKWCGRPHATDESKRKCEQRHLRAKPGKKGLPKTEDVSTDAVLDEATFTRQNYVAIAQILNKNRPPSGLKKDIIDVLTNDFMNYFEEDNPAFNREVFLKAVPSGSTTPDGTQIKC